MKAIPLSPETVEMLSRPIRGHGGFQQLMRRIQAGLEEPTQTLHIEQDDLDALVRAVRGPHVGGFQLRARAILVDRVIQALLDEGIMAPRQLLRSKVLPFVRAGQRHLPLEDE